MSNFQLIESTLSQLLKAADQTFSSEEKTAVQELIDVGEYGLALETSVDIYFEEKKTATSEVLELVEYAASLMELDAEKLLSKMRK
jgi:uncharacterized tellurite resistance protein B-like protein